MQENTRRGNNRPQQALYIPGCGPLRKSDTTEEETTMSKPVKNIAASRMNRFRQEEFSRTIPESVNEQLQDKPEQGDRKRNRKPEQQIYVPTPVAKARQESEKKVQIEQEIIKNERSNKDRYDKKEKERFRNDYMDRNDHNLNGSHNQEHDRHSHRNKRYSSKRKGNDSQDEWRNASPNRTYRQGSEPRPQQQSWDRVRDTRSVEPAHASRAYQHEIQSRNPPNAKPPSGRRHSTIGVEPDKRQKPQIKLDNLPPRLRKKRLEEAGLLACNQVPEESWDGSSITFQGTTQNSKGNALQSNQHVSANNRIYNTLPNNRPRGRGRINMDYGNIGNKPGMLPYRPATPDKFSSHSSSNSTPTLSHSSRTRSNESLNRGDSRSQTPVNNRKDDYNYNSSRYPRHQNQNRNYLRDKESDRHKEIEADDVKHEDIHLIQEKLSATKITSPPAGKIQIQIECDAFSNEIFDWSEEVEMHVKNLEEGLSDALTRSSSMTSLTESVTKPPSRPRRGRKKRDRRNRRSTSSNRDRSVENQNRHSEPRHSHQNRTRKNSGDHQFKVPDARPRRDRSFDRGQTRSRNGSREPSFERHRKISCSDSSEVNWREEIRARTVEKEPRLRRTSDRDDNVRRGGLLHLPKEGPKPPVLTIKDRPMSENRRSPGQATTTHTHSASQKTLFDPQNPHKPIIINKPNSRVSSHSFSEITETQSYTCTDQLGNVRPAWHHENSDNFKLSHYPDLLKNIRKVDAEMLNFTSPQYILQSWLHIHSCRKFLQDALVYLLREDMKFAEQENIEQYFWKLLYYNFIEIMRKAIVKDPDNSKQYKDFLLKLIIEGTDYYEKLLDSLQDKFNFKLENYTGTKAHTKSTGYVQLALISAQKIYICLGDLYRYKETVSDTTNYGKCRQLYIKAHEINPKNGRPYNQLAVLAFYSKKRLDAVYYYMRSLMSTNPVPSARECLISLFDENRKKYEHERKRREERLEKARQHMKEKESENAKSKHGSLRKETWIRPDGGRRMHRTTSTLQDTKTFDSEEEDLAALTSVEVNKRFVTSYLHVHGKLITKIGMETFHETALQMLKEFRALLQHSPVPLPSSRFLQLLALNMFAIESTKLKDPELQPGLRSELQERALIVSLEMFSLILEKCVSILTEHLATATPANINILPQDAEELLPSVKIWCDWMLCHSRIWNPPPSTLDYKVGPAGDAWTRVAILMNLLENLDPSIMRKFKEEAIDGYELVRLPEDNTLSGFTPLLCNVIPSTIYVPPDTDIESAQFALRLHRLLFFGTEFLCGVEPPVLKLEYRNDTRGYVSVVCTTANRSAPNTPPEFNESELMVESFSDEEDCNSESVVLENTSNEIQELLSRKNELERRQRVQELHRQTVQKILQQSVVSVHIEVKPKNLVPDTNCFIDYLPSLKTIASSNVYTLMVPLIVLNELEGLAKGAKTPERVMNPAHALKVAEASKAALDYLATRSAGVKCITTKGTILASTAFTKEDDAIVDVNATNDDRILQACMTLCKGQSEQAAGEPRKIHREVVLLTEDRNLRVKALARDVPVREVPSFLQWAGLG